MAAQDDTHQEILLSTGESVLVDREDYLRFSRFKWRLNGGGYAIRSHGSRVIFMHRAVCPPPPGMEVDHINRDKLDNRRQNLRPATRSQNMGNRPANEGRRFKGVYQNRNGKWEARIVTGGEHRYLGIYPSRHLASLAYDVAARIIFGPFARLNHDDAPSFADVFGEWADRQPPHEPPREYAEGDKSLKLWSRLPGSNRGLMITNHEERKP